LLEKTAAPVTAEQAKKLIPLFTQLQTLEADSATTTEQFQAVYTQIEGALTADQMKSIEAVTIADLQNVMSILGIQQPAGQGGFGGPNNGGTGGGQGQNQNADQRATRQAEQLTRTAAGTPNPAGAPNVSGTPDPRFQGTPRAGFAGRRGGMGSIFVAPLIEFLKQRAGG
jgi:hypothetical protein